MKYSEYFITGPAGSGKTLIAEMIQGLFGAGEVLMDTTANFIARFDRDNTFSGISIRYKVIILDECLPKQYIDLVRVHSTMNAMLIEYKHTLNGISVYDFPKLPTFIYLSEFSLAEHCKLPHQIAINLK